MWGIRLHVGIGSVAQIGSKRLIILSTILTLEAIEAIFSMQGSLIESLSMVARQTMVRGSELLRVANLPCAIFFRVWC